MVMIGTECFAKAIAILAFSSLSEEEMLNADATDIFK